MLLQSHQYNSLNDADVPPRPGSPTPLRVTKSAVVLAWDEHPCNGGHRISGFTIRYRNTYQEYLTSTNVYVYNVDPLLRNYTVVGLEPYTSYNFSVQAISDEYLPSEFSLESIITTTAEGKPLTPVLFACTLVSAISLSGIT